MDDLKRENYKKIGEKGITLASIFIFLSMIAFSSDIDFYIACFFVVRIVDIAYICQ
jgi:hypothetical protein